LNLTLTNVGKSYSDKIVINNFSYQFPCTGVVAITGESGSGKTTLLRIIAGLDKKYTGKVLGGGSKNVSFCFQEYRLFPTISAIENVLIAAKNSDANSRMLAEQLLINLGFTTADFSKLPSELSGGMKQRVALARAFLKRSDVLILDEPTKELDPLLVKSVRNMIASEGKQRLVIFTSHNRDDIDNIADICVKLQ